MGHELIAALTHQHIGLDEPNVAAALAQSEPIQVADLQDEAHSELNEITLRAGYRARLVAALLRGNEPVGLLVVRRRAPGENVDGPGLGAGKLDSLRDNRREHSLEVEG